MMTDGVLHGRTAPVDRSGPTHATALFRDAEDRNELRVGFDPESGELSLVLSGADVEGFGYCRSTLLPVSPHSQTLSATVLLNGYDLSTARFHHLEVSLGVTWTTDRADCADCADCADGDSVEVAGTALVTDLDDHTMTVYRAVRRHPFNSLCRLSVGLP